MRKNFRTYDLAVEFYRLAAALPIKGHLADQLDRAASSIVLNLAEGSGKRTNPDQRRFFQNALGSLRESQAILDLIPCTTLQAAEHADKLGAHLYRLIQCIS